MIDEIPGGSRFDSPPRLPPRSPLAHGPRSPISAASQGHESAPCRRIMKSPPTLTCQCGFSGPPAQFRYRKCCKRCWYATRARPIGPPPPKKAVKRKPQPAAERRKARLARAWALAKQKAAGARASGVTDINQRRANRVHKRRCRVCRRIRQARFMILYAASPDHRGGTCCDCSKTPLRHLSFAERKEIRRRIWAAAHAKRLAAAQAAA